MMTDREFYFRLAAMIILIVSGPVIFMFIAYKKKLEWNGKKCFKVLAPYVGIVLLVIFVLIMPSRDFKDWIFSIVLILLAVLSLYGYALMIDKRKDMKNKKK